MRLDFCFPAMHRTSRGTLGLLLKLELLPSCLSGGSSSNGLCKRRRSDENKRSSPHMDLAAEFFVAAFHRQDIPLVTCSSPIQQTPPKVGSYFFFPLESSCGRPPFVYGSSAELARLCTPQRPCNRVDEVNMFFSVSWDNTDWPGCSLTSLAGEVDTKKSLIIDARRRR